MNTLQASQSAVFHQEGQDMLIHFDRPAGLHQCTIDMDGSKVDWSRFYVALNQWGNTGQVTGPWDFSPLNGARPLVPAYWVKLDDQQLGLWYTRRVSLDDIRQKRFTGRLAFWLKSSGTHTLRLSPYNPQPVVWKKVTIEDDPEDSLLPDTRNFLAANHSVMAHMSGSTYWQQMRQKLATTHQAFAPLLAELADWSMQRWHEAFEKQRLKDKEAAIPIAPADPAAPDISPMVGNDVQSHDILVLTAAHRLMDHHGAKDMAHNLLDLYAGLENWGNPRVDGYGHNGDMFAADAFRNLAWAYHLLAEELTEDRKNTLLAKLTLQGEKFIAAALLMRDYWGGSLLQDHGFQSLPCFASGAMHLLGVIPQAADWVRFAVPRALRSLNAMPRDGVIPTSSHHSLSLYLDEMSFFRDALLKQRGQDVYDEIPAREIVQYLTQTMTQDLQLPAWGTTSDFIKLTGSQHFFNQIATKYNDQYARTVQQMLTHSTLPTDAHPMQLRSASTDRLWGFLSYNTDIKPLPIKNETQRLIHFDDSGVVYFIDDNTQTTLALRCGPWVGKHGWASATGPCDHMEIIPAPGHFHFMTQGQSFIVSPDAGYQLRSENRNILLINNKGPIGDIGYPMSIPDWQYPGESITDFQWNPLTKTGHVSLNLTPAYEPACGLSHYTRTFHFQANSTILIEDDVKLDQPAKLKWVFHTPQSCTITTPNDRAAVLTNTNTAISIHAQAAQTPVKISTAPTHVVRSYTAQWGAIDFHHAAFEPGTDTRQITMRFELKW